MDIPHGVAHQINTVVLDKDSDITGRGKHNRLLVFKDPGARQITIREDILGGLPMSTERDRRRVANGWQRLHPKGARLVHVESVEGQVCSWPSIWHEYTY